VNVTLYSFGFKYGHPQADLVWDVRFIPNPYWVPELQAHTGLEPQVARYVLENETGARFLALLEPLLVFLLDEFAARGREMVTLAVGCTGGRHRSVAVTEHLRSFLQSRDVELQVYHRDIDKIDKEE
jgi:RNase adaptor protein for sRNA GlmZ degradation